MNELDELLETGFAGREVTLVENLIEELDRIEHDTDTLQIKLRSDLFQTRERTYRLSTSCSCIRSSKWIGDVADRAQRVGNRLEQLMAASGQL